MSEHRFQMRHNSRYEQPDNAVADLLVDLMEDGQWRTLDLNVRSPGFQVFVYAVLTCQHMYFRTNCTERGLALESADGSVLIVADEDWRVQTQHVRFHGRLASGSASGDDIEYIRDRMEHCPVATNLKAIADSRTEVSFD